MLGKDELLKRLEERNIPFSCEQHDSVLNMAESGMLTLSLQGARCKNLLLQDKRVRSESSVDLTRRVIPGRKCGRQLTLEVDARTFLHPRFNQRPKYT